MVSSHGFISQGLQVRVSPSMLKKAVRLEECGYHRIIEARCKQEVAWI
jgi:hypothetical protein